MSRDHNIYMFAFADTSLSFVPLHSTVAFSPPWAFAVDDGDHSCLSFGLRKYSFSCILSGGFLASMGVFFRWQRPPVFVLSPFDIFCFLDPLWWFSRLNGRLLSMTVTTFVDSLSFHYLLPLSSFVWFLTSFSVSCRWKIALVSSLKAAVISWLLHHR